MVSPGTCLWQKHHEQVPEPSSGPDVAVARLCSGMKKLFQFDHTLVLCWAVLDSAMLAVLVKTFTNRNSSRPTELLRTPALHLQPCTSLKCLLNVSPSKLSRTLLILHIVFDLISIQSENKQTPPFSIASIPFLCRVSALICSAFLTTLYWNCIGM